VSSEPNGGKVGVHDDEQVPVAVGAGVAAGVAAEEDDLNVQVPLRRCELPGELREIAPVSLVAGSAAFGGEVMGDRPRSPEEPPRRASALATKPATSSKVKAVQKPLTLDETPQAGKPKKLALTAAICELAVILNAILRTGTPWRAAETAA